MIEYLNRTKRFWISISFINHNLNAVPKWAWWVWCTSTPAMPCSWRQPFDDSSECTEWGCPQQEKLRKCSPALLSNVTKTTRQCWQLSPRASSPKLKHFAKFHRINVASITRWHTARSEISLPKQWSAQGNKLSFCRVIWRQPSWFLIPTG